MGELVAHALSGGLSALLSSALLHPLEAIRTKLQALAKSQGLLTFLRETYQKEGLAGFYSGFSALVLTNVLSYAVYFFLYRICQRLVLTKGRSLAGHMKVSIQASFGATVLNAPLWVVSSRLMKDGSQSIVQCLRSIVENEGFRGLFKGLGASLLLVANPVIQFALYEWLKDRFLSSRRTSTLPTFFLFAAISKAIATLATYPLLTIRTRQQLEKEKTLSQLQVARDLLRTDGVWGLYRGIHTKMVQTVLNTAIIMVTHENLALLLTKLLAAKVEVKVLNTKSV